MKKGVKPVDRWHRTGPLHRELAEAIEDARLQALQDHAVGPHDLPVGPRVGDRGPVDPDVVVVAEAHELFP
jgi:hypothetical protein